MRSGMENTNRLGGIIDTSPTTNGGSVQLSSGQHLNQPSIAFNHATSQTSSAYHRKSHSLDAATISSQIGKTTMTGASAALSMGNRNKAYALNERYAKLYDEYAILENIINVNVSILDSSVLFHIRRIVNLSSNCKLVTLYLCIRNAIMAGTKAHIHELVKWAYSHRRSLNQLFNKL